MTAIAKRLTWPRALAALAIIAAATLAAVLLLGGDDSSSDATGPREVSAAELRGFADDSDQPVYWAGEQPGTKLELTETEAGDVYVRYLGTDTEVGSPQPDYLTVATYPTNDAYAALQATAKRGPGKAQSTLDGGLVFVPAGQPQRAYIAHPGAGYQIEIYDPSPKRALALALSGAVTPIG